MPMTARFMVLRRGGASPSASLAFTRLELLVVIATLVLLVSVVLPVLASTKPRADQATCLNNLRQIGQAFRLWGSDYQDQTPWAVLYSAGGTWYVADGGNRPPWLGMQNNPWFHFMWLSNELSRPSLLACPSDPKALAAWNWSTSPYGGFLNPNYRNNAVSYFLGLHATADFPRAALCGDRNLKTNGISSCSLGITAAAFIYTRPDQEASFWGPAIHGSPGNLLLNDGQVQAASSAELNRALHQSWDGNGGSVHFLFPR